MVSFRRSVLVLTVLAIFAGVVSAQGNLAVPPVFTPSIVRSEGVTELLPSVQFNNGNPPSAGNFNFTVYSSVTVTSAPGEAMLTVNDPGEGATVSYVGTVSGNSITFGTPLAPVAIKVTTSSVVLSGVRINASQLPNLASGATSGIGESLLMVAAPSDLASSKTLFGNTSPVYSIPNVAYAVATLAIGTSSTGMAPATGDTAAVLSICSTTPFDPTAKGLSGAAFWVSATELYSGAFLNMAGEALGTADAAATNGTQFQFTFTNLPANTALYVPATYSNGMGLTLSLVAPAASSSNTSASGPVLVPASGIVVYEVMASTTGIDAAFIPVYVAYTGQAGLTGTTIPAVTGQYAPISTNAGAATKPIPRFVGTPQTSNAFTFSTVACTTSLLFNYLVSTGGYDAGIAISNTGMTPSGSAGESGACTWYFYGTGAPAAPVVGAAIAPGTTGAVVLSSIAPGFQGYAVAQCAFNYAVGYAYLVNGNTNSTTSYLPLALGSGSKHGRGGGD
jgi:hypothetical protein